MLFYHMHPVLVVQRHMYGDTWHTAGVAAYRARYSARVLQFQTRVYSGPPCAEHSIVLICEALPWFVLRWSETNGWAFWIAGVPTVCVPEQVCASQPRRSARIPTCGVIVVAAAHAGCRNVSSLYVVRDAVLVRMLPLLMRR